MSERVIPSILCPNEHHLCWTCFEEGRSCDGNLPDCTTCVINGQICEGYGVRLNWPVSIHASTQQNHAHLTPSMPHRSHVEARFSTVPASLSPFQLSPPENGYLNHFLRHISSIALAVDYTGNGYRTLLPMAVEEPALLNAMLAVASSHKSKWQQVEDHESRKYLLKSLGRLREIISDPKVAVQDSTLGIMLTLVCYEVFNGSTRWKQHFSGIISWLKLRGDCSDLSSFTKTWICMINTQAALNLGHVTISEVDDWLDSAVWEGSESPVIDPLFGCSTKLPKLMLEAARIYRLSQSSEAVRAEVRKLLWESAEALKLKIDHAELEVQSTPSLAVTCGHSGLVATAIESRYCQPDYSQQITATAEIFRHALLVYLFRVVNGPDVALDSQTQLSVDKTLSLLPLVPDAVGPGSNLGWALVVIGTEIDIPDLRQYIRYRWHGLNLMELNNSLAGERVTEEVWRRRDAATCGTRRVHWQDVLRDLEGEQILL